MHKKYLLKSNILAVALLLGGCVAVPSITATKIDSQVHTPVEIASWSNDIQKVDMLWWNFIDSAQLKNLIQESLEANKDIKIAKLNLEKVNALLVAAADDKMPTVGLTTSLQREKLSAQGMYPPPYAGAVIEMAQLGVGVRYSIDYLDKTNSAVAEQEYKASALAHQANAITMMVSTQIAKLYLNWQLNSEKLSLIDQKISKVKDMLAIYEKGLELGKTTPAQVRQAKQDLLQLSLLKTNLQASKDVSVNAISQLVGKKVDLIDEPGSRLLTKQLAQVDISAVRNRPDVAYYFDLINAQEKHLQLLRTDFYPSISLSADLGLQKVGFDNIFNKKALFWNIGPALSLPIFDAGRITTNYKLAGIDANIFIESYNKAVLQAIVEINESALKHQAIQQALAIQENVGKLAEESLLDKKNLFKTGKTTQLAVIAQELEVLTAKEQVTAQTYNEKAARLDLIKAVGGI